MDKSDIDKLQRQALGAYLDAIERGSGVGRAKEGLAVVEGIVEMWLLNQKRLHRKRDTAFKGDSLLVGALHRLRRKHRSFCSDLIIQHTTNPWQRSQCQPGVRVMICMTAYIAQLYRLRNHAAA